VVPKQLNERRKQLGYTILKKKLFFWLPRNLCNRSVREESYKQLAELIQDQNTQSQRNRNQPKLNGNRRREEQCLEAWNLGNKNSNGKTDEHAEEQPRVATLLGERIGLDDAEAAVAHRENVTPLEDDEGNKVHALAGVVELVELILGVAVEAVGVTLEKEEELVNGNAGRLPHVEEEHGMGAKSFSSTSEEVGLAVDLQVDEMVLLVVSRRQRQKIKLFLLHDQRERQEQIGEDTNHNHEK
jgi:hypothetical protein